MLRRLRPHHALLLTLAIMWANYALTARWSEIPGSVHGRKQIAFLVCLVVTTLASIWFTYRAPAETRSEGSAALDVAGRRLHLVVLLAGLGCLGVGFLIWFPPGTWSQIPNLDNWPTRFQATVDGIGLFTRGAVSGWEWRFLGGYQGSSDITQNLSAVGALPMWLFGNAPGFHLLHAVMLFAIPGLIWLDTRGQRESATSANLAVGLVAFTVTGWFSYYLLRSGDTNSLAGVLCSIAALTGSHAAARGLRWGPLLLVGSMALVSYSHSGFFIYSVGLLALEALYYRDLGRVWRSLVAAIAGVLVALPLTWESWRFGEYLNLNNVDVTPGPFLIEPFLRKIYYNVETLLLPGRWFNDFPGLANILIPVLAWTAWKDRSRTGFYALASVAIIAMMNLNTPELGYVFLRPVHFLAILPPAALAGFLVRQLRDRRLTMLVTTLVAIYLQYLWMPLPHLQTPADVEPALVQEAASLDGALILLENAPHRDMDVDPVRYSEKTPFRSHIEAYLAEATGKRFYAGLWDGWQWSKYRTQELAGGAFRGRNIKDVPIGEFTAELSRWGVRHLLVWSRDSRAYLSAHPEFVERWSHDRWVRFEYLAADVRGVVTSTGSGALTAFDALSGTVSLTDVRAGSPVTIRTNYFPAWSAMSDGRPVALRDYGGQLGFEAPRDGSYTVTLSYPHRPGLIVLAILVFIVAQTLAIRLTPGRSTSPDPGTA